MGEPFSSNEMSKPSQKAEESCIHKLFWMTSDDIYYSKILGQKLWILIHPHFSDIVDGFMIKEAARLGILQDYKNCRDILGQKIIFALGKFLKGSFKFFNSQVLLMIY